MQDTDKEYIVFDFIKSLYAVLPRDYQIGMIAFNNEICAEVPLGSSYAEAAECLQELSYSRYGNAGAGLAEAVAMFGPKQDKHQCAELLQLSKHRQCRYKQQSRQQKSGQPPIPGQLH